MIMKYLKIFGIFLLIVIAVTVIFSLVIPARQHLEKTITINASAATLYPYLSRLESFNKWSVWNRGDSALKNTLSGTDGTVGAINTWTGDPDISGDGEIQITELEPYHKVKYDIRFLKPKKMEADSYFELEEIKGQTKLTWKFDLATPRPWNIFNLFYNMDNKIGKDFEDGLAALKTMVEKNTAMASPGKMYPVQELNFPATSFACYRQQVKWNDMLSFFAQHLPSIHHELENANITPGTPAGLFYVWDEKNQQADMAAAIPVPAGTIIRDTTLQVVNIPASKAVYVDYYGAYDKIAGAYKSIAEYLAANNLKQKAPTMEHYITDPAKEKDTAKWLTKIIFLVE
jgi:effector-binding domain-containing protein